MKFVVICVLVPTLLFWAGCAVGPDYTAVPLPEPNVADVLQDRGAVIDANDLAAWWNRFDDPLLVTLVEAAVHDGFDIKEAGAKVRQSRAALGFVNAALYPTLDAGGSYTRRQDSENASLMPGGTSDYDVYQLGFDAGWEIDIFGGTRRSVEAARADLQAQQANLNAVAVSLVSETALNYISLRTLQRRLDVAQKNLQTQLETLELLNSRFDSGLIDELPVQQARYNLETTRSMIPGLEAEIEAVMNALAVLTGVMPGTLHEQLAQHQVVPTPSIQQVAGIPADALRQRPDVRLAERQLAAQTARIGAAESDLYPKFRLFGSIGLESFDASNLFESKSDMFSFGSGFSWPVFRAGSIRQNIKVQTALQEQVLARYEKIVLTAVKEVRDALVAYARQHQTREALYRATAAAQRAVAIAQDQYNNGLVDFSNVLDAQRSLLMLEDDLAASDGAIAGDMIRLYKALGGGWQTMAVQDSSNAAVRP